MKNLVFVFIIMMLGVNLQAQTISTSSSPEFYTKQVGFNFTNFALQFLSFNEATGGTPSILVLYKKGDERKKRRIGIGGRIYLNKNNINNKMTDESIEFNLNIGREYHNKVAKKWKVYYGYETLFRTGFSKVTYTNSRTLETDENSLLRLSMGMQALMGIQYNFNERVSLLTESSYALVFSYQKNGLSEERYGLNTYYFAPVSLILNYHF